MKTAIIFIFSGIIIMLLAGNIRRTADPAKSGITFPMTDTTFIHQEGDAFYLIQISRLDTDNVPKDEEQ